MKKIFFTGLLSLAFFTQVVAQEDKQEAHKLLNIDIDTRFDFKSDFDSEYSFQTKNIKVILSGEVTPGIRYRLRQRLNKPQDPLARDNTSKATDHAYLEFDAGNNWTFTVGKQSVQFGTFEFSYNPSDIYLSSLNNGDLDSYKLGINTAYRTKDQTFNLQIVNGDAPQFASKDYAKKGFGGLFLWEGSLFHGVLNTRYGLGVFHYDKEKYLPWITIGNRLNLDHFTAELDWFKGEKNAELFDEEMLVHDQSVVVNFIYRVGKFSPQIKGVWDQRKTHDNFTNLAQDNETTKAFQAALEYYPFESERLKDLRFHTAFQYKDYNTDKKNENILLVGVRWMFNVL